MRIVHTSDWHAGRTWRGIDRLPELEAALDHLAEFVARERIDLVLVSGDVFDSGAPPARAEYAVFRFLRRLGAAGVPSVVIAGNHDQPQRIDAWGMLAELVGVHARGLPKRAADGGVIEITTRTGERAVVAALPFAPVRHHVSALTLAGGDTHAAQTYAEGVARMVALLAEHFRSDAVNLLCAHTHLEQARFSGSERLVHLGDDWAASPQAMPAQAHYIALGHIHRPQQVAAPAPACYAGSVLQLDFGEAGETKSFVVVEATAGQPARIERIPYAGGKPLARVRATLAELEARAAELRTAGWLEVTVPLDRPDPELARRVRALLPATVAVHAELPVNAAAAAVSVKLDTHTPAEVFAAYYEQTHHRTADPALVEQFTRLHLELTAEG